MRLKKSVIAVVFFFLAILFFSCADNLGEKKNRKVFASDVVEGKKLASVYCQSCHLLPEPSLLDAKTWLNGVFPVMGPRLGIFEHEKKSYPYSKYDLELGKDFYPAKPMLTDDQWQQIIDYYTFLAPDSLQSKQSRKYPIKNDTSLFTPRVATFKYYSPSVSFVKIDTSRKDKPVIIADAVKNRLYRFDKNLKLVDSAHTKSPIVDILSSKSSEWISCNIGMLSPNNGKYGSVRKISFHQNGKLKEDTAKLFDGLQRPVQVLQADINRDGKE
ncbi:MAG: VCBS repeat-containing protein, partial [Bacteroidetes bacterium]|nr:VCBS repeat-containing protein [Bacteroidota bacterium]